MSRAYYVAAFVGIAAAMLYIASPLTAWLVVAAVLVIRCAVRGAAAAERRWVTAVLVAALAIRVAAVIVLFVTSRHDRIVSFFWDGDGLYFKQRADVIAALWNGVPVGPYDLWEAFHRSYGWSAYIYVLAYVQYLVGPAPYALHLFNVLLFVSALVLLYRVARASYGRTSAMIALTIALFLPTLFSWSVAALKESLYVVLEAAAIAALLAAVRGTGPLVRIAAAIALIAALIAIAAVRADGLVIAAGLACGAAAAWLLARPLALGAAVVAFAVVGVYVLQTPAAGARVLGLLTRAAVIHVGQVKSGGNSYRLLDDRLYDGDSAATMTAAEAARFAVRAPVSVVVVPLPWQLRSASELMFLPQQMIWYVLVLLAVPGFIAGVNRDPLFTCLLGALTAIVCLTVAFTGGNIGSMVRLRDTAVPLLIWISGVGAETCAARIAGLRQRAPRVWPSPSCA